MLIATTFIRESTLKIAFQIWNSITFLFSIFASILKQKKSDAKDPNNYSDATSSCTVFTFLAFSDKCS